jgi:hypothetical protein
MDRRHVSAHRLRDEMIGFDFFRTHSAVSLPIEDIAPRHDLAQERIALL